MQSYWNLISPHCQCTSERRDRHKARAHLRLPTFTNQKCQKSRSHKSFLCNQKPQKSRSHKSFLCNQKPQKSRSHKSFLCNQSLHSPIPLRVGSACRLPNQIHSIKADLTKNIHRICYQPPLGHISCLGLIIQRSDIWQLCQTLVMCNVFFTWLYWFFLFWWFLCRTNLTNDTLHGLAAWVVGQRWILSFSSSSSLSSSCWSSSSIKFQLSPCCLYHQHHHQNQDLNTWVISTDWSWRAL